MKSMTGFGQAKLATSVSQIEVSLRSVNGRFLETRFHLPREFVGFEADLKKIIGKYFERGTLDIFVSRRIKASALHGQVVVNKELARHYLDAYKLIAKELKIKSQFHVETIARLPEVMKVEDAASATAAEKKALVSALDKACQACDGERKREGKSLKKDLEDNLEKLEKEITQIQSVREEVNQGLLSKFEQKIKARLGSGASGIEIDASRLSQEVVIQLEKADINEELSRLKEHIKNYRELYSQSTSQGKKLDFYTQELLREVNTIGSKSSVSKLTHIVVEAKTLIERLREQVQNVE